MSAGNVFEEALHPRGFHGRFAAKMGAGGKKSAAAAFLRGAGKGKLHGAVSRPMAPSSHPGGSVEGRIHSAFNGLSENGKHTWVGLADLREHPALAGVSRTDVDAALKRIEQHPHANIVPESNQKMLTERDRHAAVVIGAQQKHLLTMGRQYSPAVGSGHTGTSSTEKARALGAKLSSGSSFSAFGKPAPAKSARSTMAAARTPRSGLAHSPEEAASRLKAMGSTEEANAYLAKATKADLLAVSEHAGVAQRKSDTKAKLQEALVHHAVTRKLNSDVISGHSRAPHSTDKNPTLTYHLSLADRALARGDHAAAGGHLLEALNATTDRATADSIRNRYAAISGHSSRSLSPEEEFGDHIARAAKSLPGSRSNPIPSTTPTKTVRSVMAAVGKPSAGDIAARLNSASSRDEARQILAKSTRADLVAVAAQLGLSHKKSITKADLLSQVLGFAVGGRLTTDAMRRL